MELIRNIVLQLPNFAGLALALVLLLRQNAQLTQALIQVSRDCDCRDAIERRTEADNIIKADAQRQQAKPLADPAGPPSIH